MLCAEDSSAQGSGQDGCRQGVHAAASEALAHVDVLSMFMMFPTCGCLHVASLSHVRTLRSLSLLQGKAAPAAKGKGVTGKLRVMKKGEKTPEEAAQASTATPPTDVEATTVVA